MEYGGGSISGGDGGSGGDPQDSSDSQSIEKQYHCHTSHQIQRPEPMFKECPHPDEKQRMQLSRELALAPTQIERFERDEHATEIEELGEEEVQLGGEIEIQEEHILEQGEHATEIEELGEEEVQQGGEIEIQEERILEQGDHSSENRKPRGWRVIPYILGTETLQRIAVFGLFQNFMLYSLNEFHMDQVDIISLLSAWGGVTGFAPFIGAFIADAYVGRFKTILVGACSTFGGLLILTLVAWVPHLHPEKCYHLLHPEKKCAKPTRTQKGVFLTGLCFLTAGIATVMPSSIPFGVDQFDPKTEEGVKGIASFINWYYASFTFIMGIIYTLVSFILCDISWAIGFTILTALMLCGIVIFLTGSGVYVLKRPEGSIYTGVIQVFVVYYKKRKVELPDECLDGVYYDPPSALLKVNLTNHFRFLNKAAVVQENDLNSDGTRKNPWRLSTVRAVEDVKCLIRVMPILLSGMISLSSVGLLSSFLTPQALVMDRNLGKFAIPPTSLPVISMLTVCICIPFYDRILVPKLRKFTKHGNGITSLQRMGIGIMFYILSMIIAGVVEKERRSTAQRHRDAPPMSVFWLAPQLILLGFCEAFCNVGQIDFYNKELPQHMGSIAGALFPLAIAGSGQLSTVVIKLVHRYTKTKHHDGWFTNDLNVGRLDYFFYLLAIIGVVNMVYHVYVARRYRYVARTSVEENEVEPSSTDV